MLSNPALPPGYQHAEEFYRRLFEPGFGRITAGVDLSASPNGRLAAFTGTWLDHLEGQPSKAVCLADLGTGQISRLSPAGSSRPAWAPSSDRLAFISDHELAGTFQPYVVDLSDRSQPIRIDMPRLSAESVEWSRDGSLLLVVAAEEGAEQPAVNGSGVPVRPRPQGADWIPTVRRSGPGAGGWRRAFVIDLAAAKVRLASPSGLNVWEACWAGPAVLAVASEGPGEGDWANSTLELMAVDGSWQRRLHQPRRQLACPAAAADGSRLAIVEGVASDRGLVAGQALLFDANQGSGIPIAAGSLDVTWLQFRNRDRLCLAGVRDTDCVFAEVDLTSGRLETHLDSGITTSGPYPSAAVRPAGGLLLMAEGWRQPPELALVERGRRQAIASLAQSGHEWLAGQLGPMSHRSWESRDGLMVSGLYARPLTGNGPFPTVLLVHGGPAHLWLPSWPGKLGSLLLASYLVACGFAILLPNPRGSSGRGQEYLELEIGDYGGGEVDDDLAGLDRLIADQLADPERLAVMGGSHGGYMTCWLTTRTQRFKAAVAISPVTDWYSQHFSSNIPDFDSMYLGADPGPADGPYFQRSPTFFAARSRTPTLLTAGLQDRCTPPGQAVEFHQALAAAGVETELVLYPGEGHGVRSLPAAIDLAARVADFLERHLRPGRQPDAA